MIALSWLVTERRVTLGSRCTVDDVCDDVSASCVDDICACPLTHYYYDGHCGNYHCYFGVLHGGKEGVQLLRHVRRE